MKIWTRVTCMAVVIGISMLGDPVPACANGCGFRPLKPLIPLGCVDLIARCQCDENAENCRWIWECVPG